MKYVNLIRDIQHWYAAKEGNDGTALETALLLLSGLGSANVFFAVCIINGMLHGEPVRSPVDSSHRVFLVGLPIIVIALHMIIAKVNGLSSFDEFEKKCDFPRAAKIYLIFTAIMFLLFIVPLIIQKIMESHS